MKALLFDFDGLIVDTETPEVLAWEQVFSEHGVPFPHEWFLENTGRGREQIEVWPEDLLAEGVPGLSAADAKVIGRTRCLALIEREPIRPGVLALLDEAVVADVRCAIVSSSHMDWIEGHLVRLGMLGRFDDYFTADRVERAKPFPDLYRLALATLGIAAEEAIALEDSRNGVVSAKEAGLRVVAVPNDATRHMDLSPADRVVSSLADLTLRELWENDADLAHQDA